MTIDEFRASAVSEVALPVDLTEEEKALWLCAAGRWDEAHECAQEIHTPMGSWIHALLHLIEGDVGNAGYWFTLAGRKPVSRDQIDAEWRRIAAEVLAER